MNTGAFDPLEPIAAACKQAGAWLHVDGAFGLWAAASSRRHLTAGAEHADSWAADAHKWLNVPYDSGLAIVRDREAHRAAMGLTAAYLVESEHRQNYNFTPEASRRARGFAIYAALRSLGRSGLLDLVDRCCDHARALRGDPARWRRRSAQRRRPQPGARRLRARRGRADAGRRHVLGRRHRLARPQRDADLGLGLGDDDADVERSAAAILAEL